MKAANNHVVSFVLFDVVILISLTMSATGCDGSSNPDKPCVPEELPLHEAEHSAIDMLSYFNGWNIEVPRGRSRTALIDGILLTIGSREIRVFGDGIGITTKNWREAGEACPGRDRGCLPHLFMMLKHWIIRYRRKGRMQPLVLFADRRTHLGLLKRVVQTASHAGIKTIQLVVRGPDGKLAVNLLRLPWPECPSHYDKPHPIEFRRVRRFGASRGVGEFGPPHRPNYLNLTVDIQPSGYAIRSVYGVETCQSGQTSCLISKQGAGLRQLAHRLWYLFSSKYRSTSDYPITVVCGGHTIRIVADDSIEYSEFIRVMDTIRYIPQDATNLLPAKRPILWDCEWQVNRKHQHFFLPTSSHQQSCLYHIVSLELGPPKNRDSVTYTVKRPKKLGHTKPPGMGL